MNLIFPFQRLSFSLLSFQALSVSSTSKFLRVNSSLAKTRIDEKNFTYVAVDICVLTRGPLADEREVVLQWFLLLYFN